MRPIVIFGIVLVVGLTVYSNALFAGFHFDDFAFIVNNYPVHHIEKPELIWENFPTRFIGGISFALNYHFFKLNTFSYHFVNIIIHILNAFLVFILAKTIFSSPFISRTWTNAQKHWMSLVAALIFLVHPIQTESVTYITQRFACLGAFFYLCAVIAYIQARLSANRMLYILSLIATILAMFTKEFSFTIPIVLILCEIFFVKRESIKSSIFKIIPFLMSMAIIPLVLFLSGDQNASIKLNEQLSMAQFSWHNFLTQINVLRTYLRLMILPINQNLDYDYPMAYYFFELPTILSFLLLGMLFALGVYLFKKERVISFCIMWFFVTISVEFAAFSIIGFDMIFEHCLYLPMVGFAICASILLVTFIGQPKTTIILSSVLIMLLAGMTYKRNGVWHSRLTLWEDVIKKSPNKARPYNNLAIYYDEIKDHGKAIELYKKAIEMDPKRSAYYINLGSTYGQIGIYDKAVEYTLKGIDIKDNYKNLPKAYMNLGYVYDKIGALDKSIQYYQEAIKRDPYNPQIYVNLSAVYLKLGKNKMAVRHARDGIALDPDIAEAYNNLGMAYGQDGKTAQAIEHFQKGITVDPNSTPIYINLGRAYIKQNSIDDAINTFEQCLQIEPAEAQAHFLLGFSYLKIKRVDKAIAKINDLRSFNENKFADSLEMLIKERNLLSL